MSTTRQALRRAMYDGRVPGLGFSGTADSVAAGSITDAYALADTNLSTKQFTGMYIYRPDLSGDDVVRVAGTLTVATGALLHTGANYSDTSDLDYELIGLMHPDELNACITRAMKRVYREVQLPLSGKVTDGDMQAANVNSWASVGTPSTKEKTATNAFSGDYSLHILNDATNEGAKCNTISVPGGVKAYVSTVVKADVGTATLQLYDETNSAEIASVTCDEEAFMHLWLEATIPTTCEEVTVRLLGAEANADIYWDHALLYLPDQYLHAAPSWLDEQFKFQKLREAKYEKQAATANQTYGSYDDAYSRHWSDWHQPSAFSLETFHADVNPYMIQLNRPPPRNELWIQAQRPYSDTEPLTADTDATTAPRDLVEAYILNEIAKTLVKRYPTAKQWQELRDESEKTFASERQARPPLPMQPERRREQPNRGRI